MRFLPVVALCIAATVAMGASRHENTSTRVRQQPDTVALASRILELTLDEREKLGGRPRLKLNPILAMTAQEHSDDMVARNYFDHKDPDGKNSLRRVFAHNPKFQGALGENIASHKFTRDSGFDVERFAHVIVQAWLDSPGHKATMLSPIFRETGIGVAMTKDEVFVTQMFSGPVPAIAVQRDLQRQTESHSSSAE